MAGHIVFDLLGDLYLLPIEGGTATRLTEGPAMDLQPRFSPDGTKISFTSDRAGGDNLWTINADGTDPTQITKESYRLLNNAVWTPDGQYLIAKKHFTSTRSIGAGEMWMYHVSGGKGLQLTKRKNDQQDVGEPAMAPDGRALYFSEDMSPGPRFQYNKDPNGQIYVIRELDLETGRLRNLITGNGGSARPQVSPDGRWISFVRRVRTKSVLTVYDRLTGHQRPLFDGLTQDQQEAWAIYGVYPNYAWMPDGHAIVIWAKGGIWKVTVADGEAESIPFEARVNQTVSESPRGIFPVSPDSFDVRMIRDLVTSPDGKTVVFHALGHLWKKDLPDGAPERLTDDAHFEYQPDFSPDGLGLVYTTWQDGAYGHIRVMQLQSDRELVLTQRPGHYFEPRFSPDGSKIVYRRGRGNRIRGTLHGVDTGLYWMDAHEKEPHFIREGGRDARFDASGERIYFLSGGGLNKQYKSVRLDGGDERTHFNLKYPARVVPSPDGSWVAFQELFNAYIAPFPKTGGAIDLHKDSNAIPVKKVSRDAGNYLHWSGDGSQLHWTIGPEYFSQPLNATFGFVEGASDPLPELPDQGQNIGFSVTTDVPSGTVALKGARIITMKGKKVIEKGTVLVTGNRIVKVGKSRSVNIPEDAHVIDASGKTIIPGIIDVHAHNNHWVSGPLPQTNWSYLVNLAYGVTTGHDPSANTDSVFSLAELVKAGKIVGPRVFSTGTILYGADGDFRAKVDSLEDARSHLRRMQAVGAFSVKSYNQPRRDQRQQILQAARELGMLVVNEGGSTFFQNVAMLIDGTTGIEHNMPVAPLYNDVIGLWAKTNVFYSPTMVVSFGGITGEFYWYQHSDVWEKQPLMTFTPRTMVDSRSRRRLKLPESEFHHIQVARSAKSLTDKGVKVCIGAHGQLQGLAAHWEMWMLAQGGMTPMEVLRSATLNGAEYLGLDQDLGSLEKGKLADLAILASNPLENIRNTDSVEMVMINGRLFESKTMNQIGNHPKQRSPLYWESGSGHETGLSPEQIQSTGCGCRP